MQKRMKMKAYLTKEEDGNYIARAELFDGTPITLKVGRHEALPNEPSNGQEVEGFIIVTQLALQDARAYIELPEGTINHGKNVLVNKLNLFDPNATIEDYIG